MISITNAADDKGYSTECLHFSKRYTQDYA